MLDMCKLLASFPEPQFPHLYNEGLDSDLVPWLSLPVLTSEHGSNVNGLNFPSVMVSLLPGTN